jgi:dihydroneopterin aldolase
MMDSKIKNSLQDWIIIEGLSLSCQIGITADERKNPQELIFDLKLAFDLRKAGHSDQLDHTIDYAQVIDTIKNILRNQSYSLIETVAADVSERLLQTTPAKELVLKVLKKPFSNVSGTGVILHRRKQRASHGKIKKAR